ncbi:hypothetical protein [Celeribacter sp. PS-C1]|uniref:hypothetical protein n=1 Tax=Celeribacter sp. PS-C1 TaxID=2820813 RepID=UPI001CA5CDF1|nr:hypothetical protein [Celeribacter sp. PS-C1]MBW6418043.1 hypothetical protein [Celeribacter sp. PS-C1]
MSELTDLSPVSAEVVAVHRAMPEGIHLATEMALIEAATVPVANMAEVIVLLEAETPDEEEIRQRAIKWLDGRI